MGRARAIDVLWEGLEDDSGNPLAAGKVYTYIAGTTTNKTTWTAVDKSSSAANPIILDAYGRAQIYGDGVYKFVVKDSSDATLYTIDNVSVSSDTSVLAWAGTSSGAANIYNLTVSPAVTEYSSGQSILFNSHQTNTSSSITVTVNGLASKTLVRADGIPIHIGDIVNGGKYQIVYSEDAGQFLLMNPSGGYLTWTPTLGGTGAMTFTTTTINIARYSYVSVNEIAFSISFSGTTGGVASYGLTATLPVTASSTNYVFSGYAGDPGPIAGFGTMPSTTVVEVRRYDNGNYGLGAGRAGILQGRYFI